MTLHIKHVRITAEVKEKLELISFKLKIPESHIASDILRDNLEEYERGYKSGLRDATKCYKMLQNGSVDFKE